MAAFDDYLQGAPADNTVDPLTVTASAQPPMQDPGITPQASPDLTLSGQQQPDAMQPQVSQGSQSPDLNYNNSQSANAMSSALLGEGAPRGGMANPGLYGVLPAGLQHGTLRNMLGALGDAFLVGSGHQAQYEPRMQRQEIGQAMAGYNPNDPASAQAAIQRIAGTGAAGSTEMADQLQKNTNDLALRKQLMEQNQNYHQQTLQSKNDNLFNRMNSVAQADLAQAKTPEDYKARLARWDQRVKAVDPTTDAVSQFGVPDTYTPGAVNEQSGMSSNQVAQDKAKAASRVQAGRDTDVNANSRIQAAGMGDASRNRNTDVNVNKPTSATILQGLIAKQNAGQPLTPAEQAAFNHMTSAGKTHATLPANLNVKPGGGQGGKPQPTAADLAYVHAHPETRGAFQAHFGVNP